MDVTPESVRAATFKGALRGYKVEDVDAFVEQMALGVGKLLEQLRIEAERAVAAERSAEDLRTQLQASQARDPARFADGGGA